MQRIVPLVWHVFNIELFVTLACLTAGVSQGKLTRRNGDVSTPAVAPEACHELADNKVHELPNTVNFRISHTSFRNEVKYS